MSRYGWKPDPTDARDLTLSISPRIMLPDSVDLRLRYMPPVYDQANLGSCTANAIAAAMEYDMTKQGERTFRPSRLFIYFEERRREGTIAEDAGAIIRDGMKVIASAGAPPEYRWPYFPSQFAVTPPQSVYQVARKFTSLEYRRVAQTETDLLGALASGYPVVHGFNVGESFEDPSVAETGVWNPVAGERIIGGHAVDAVGYRRRPSVVIERNSWGSAWGERGYYTVPLEWLLDPSNAQDFWVLTKVS